MILDFDAMLKVHRIRSIDWNPSPIVALATSADGSQVAAAREDDSLEIWLVSPGSVGWHCLLTIQGDPDSRDPSSKMSSLVWCQTELRAGSLGRLFSSSVDGTISEWDLFNLRKKKILDTIGTSIWQMAAEPFIDSQLKPKKEQKAHQNGDAFPSGTGNVDEEDHSEGDQDDDKENEILLDGQRDDQCARLACACNDGCVKIYNISDDEGLTYQRTLPRVSGRTLSVSWSHSWNRIYSGSSDGFIRCWDVVLGHEVFRIDAGHKGEHCIWSLVALRCGTVVSGDSSGRVQFWDGRVGTLLQAHSYHKGDVKALVASPNHDRVFSSGSDGQFSNEAVASTDTQVTPNVTKRWIYISSKPAHTHDVRALTIAVPISHEDLPHEEKVKRKRGSAKPLDFSYHKWAHLGVPMLISGGEDTKLFAYPVREFAKFSQHDICPAPQRLPMQLVIKTPIFPGPLLLVQSPQWLDIYCVNLKNPAKSSSPGPSGWSANTNLVAHVECKASQKIICSTISSCGTLFAYSDQIKPNLFELKRIKSGKLSLTVNKKKLPQGLPFAHFMLFSSDSSRLVLAGHDRRIYVIDVGSGQVHNFAPCRKANCENLPPSEPPITKMFASHDDQWLAAINCFGDIYIFNLETLRQHWFISRLDGASVTAAGFAPKNGNILVVCTSSNQLFALDVEAKQMGEWSMRNTYSLPRRYQEFPGEVIGLSFQPSSTSSSVFVYSPSRGENDPDPDPDTSNNNKSISKMQTNGVLKRKHQEVETKKGGRKNFDFFAFRDPVLFVGHLSEKSLLVVDRPWKKVVNNFEFQPVDKHIYGT